MKKFLSFLPLLLTVFGLVYGMFDSTVYTYISAHQNLATYLSLAFVVSETLAATTFVKSNSVMELIFNSALTVLGKVLHKEVEPSNAEPTQTAKSAKFYGD